MMIRRLLVVVSSGWVALLGACKVEDSAIPDADLAAPLCTGIVYDNCTADGQCMSGMCKLFSGEFQVCTQACNDAAPCPTSAGMAAKCNSRGLCKPTINNACRPPS